MKRSLTIFMIFVFSMSYINAAEWIEVKQQYINNELTITPQFNLTVSEKIEEAINNGIVITFVAQANLKQEVDWWIDPVVSKKIQTFQLRYFSLSRQYQLFNTQTKTKQSFVTFEQILNHLFKNTVFTFKPSTLGNYVETRLFLDKQALPSTMQLPIVFDQDWNINSDWQRVKITPQKETQQP